MITKQNNFISILQFHPDLLLVTGEYHQFSSLAYITEDDRLVIIPGCLVGCPDQLRRSA